MSKKKYIIFPPELCDGQHSFPDDEVRWDVAMGLREWLESAADGDSIILEVKAFSDREIEDMPEI